MHMVTGLARTQDGKHLARVFFVFSYLFTSSPSFFPLGKLPQPIRVNSEWNGVGVGDASTKQGV